MYRIGSLGIESQKRLVGIPESAHGHEARQIVWVTEPLLDGIDSLVPHPSGALWADPRVPDRWAAGARLQFRLHPASESIEVWSDSPAGLLLTHLVADCVVPFYLSTKKRLVLHGAACQTNVGVVGILGPSGEGKSTLVAYCVSQGLQFLSDDWLPIAIDGRGPAILAYPAHPSVRLHTAGLETSGIGQGTGLLEDGDYNKRWLSLPESWCATAQPLKRLVRLKRSGGKASFSARRLGPEEAFRSVLERAFILEVASPEAWSAVLEITVSATTMLPVYEVVLPEGRRGLSVMLDWMSCHESEA